MSIKRQREEFIGYMVRALPERSPNEVIDFCRRVLRLSQTHGRLAVADCNGDYPADGPWIQPQDYQDPKQVQRCTSRLMECSRCGGHYAKETMHKTRPYPKVTKSAQTGVIPVICKSCRTEDNIRKVAESFGLKADFQGDPRGWTCKLIVNDREIGIPQHD